MSFLRTFCAHWYVLHEQRPWPANLWVCAQTPEVGVILTPTSRPLVTCQITNDLNRPLVTLDH